MQRYPFLIDSHAHIYGREFTADFADMLSRAREAGLSHIIAVGADLESSKEACELFRKYDSIYCAVGVHPHDADRVTEKCYDVIRQMVEGNPKVVAIGEIGLDFYRDRSPRDAQERVFRRFIRLAREPHDHVGPEGGTRHAVIGGQNPFAILRRAIFAVHPPQNMVGAAL